MAPFSSSRPVNWACALKLNPGPFRPQADTLSTDPNQLGLEFFPAHVPGPLPHFAPSLYFDGVQFDSERDNV